MDSEASVKNREADGQVVTDEADNLIFPDESERDKIMEYSPHERFYRFNDEIGFGSYKSVYRGHDSQTGRQIAWNVIKLLHLPQQQRKRLTQEIAILKNINHKKIISFINAWLNKGRNEMIFITEMVSGGSLKKHLRKIKKPRLKIIKGWCRQILEGLNYLHSQKPSPIIHRDIKCDNIFINTNTNEIRIGDLGLAIFTRDSYAQTLIGTPEFMAPEIFEGKYSTGVDIYAFGMCLLEMSTLETPYQQCKGLPQIYKHIEQRIKPKSLDLIECDSLRNFISKCLNDSNERPSAAELLEDQFFLPSEDDKKEVRLKETHSVIQQVSPEFQSTLKKYDFPSNFRPRQEEDDATSIAKAKQQNHLANSADISKMVQSSSIAHPQKQPTEKSSNESPSQIMNFIKPRDIVITQFTSMFAEYRRKVMLSVEDTSFFKDIIQLQLQLLQELQLGHIEPKHQTRKNSTDKNQIVIEQNLKDFETKSMIEVSQKSSKWDSKDFDFITPQNQTKVSHAYSTQGKYSSSKNIMIPIVTPPIQTKNAAKLAEISNKIKVELPKSNTEQNKILEEPKLRSLESLKTPQFPMPTATQQPKEMPKLIDIKRQPSQRAKKDSKSTPTSAETGQTTDGKTTQKSPTGLIEGNKPRTEDKFVQIKISTQNRNKSIPHQQYPNSAVIKSNASIIPGMLGSAPTSPNVTNTVLNMPPISPPPNIQQQQILWNALNHPQVVLPASTIPNIQPFLQQQLLGKEIDTPVQQLERTDSTKTAPEPMDLLGAIYSPKQDKQTMRFVVRARSDDVNFGDVILVQAKRLHKDISRFPMSKQNSSKQDVIILQNLLNRLLNEKLEAIGVFGHYTEELVKKFQEANKQRPDGIVDQSLFGIMIEQIEKDTKQSGRQRQASQKEQGKRQQINELARKLMSQLEADIMKKE